MDPSPVPNAKNFLHSLAGNEWFSVCDLLWGFWQQPLCKEDRPKTAFTVPGRKQHQWKVVAMGLRNSPQTQQRVMEGVLAGLDPERIMCFIDDIMIAGRTFEEQLVYLDLVLRRLHSVGLALKLKKCELLRREVHYLGHILGGGCLKRDPRLIQKALELPRPKDVTSVRGFLNCVGFYRDFIPTFTEIAEPLYELTKSGTNVMEMWNDACETAWQQLCACMASPQVLALPDFGKDFYLMTDASGVGIGAALCQLDEQERLRPILFLSRKLNKAERNYHALEREALAVVTAVTKLRYYLFGRKFTLLTDASALRQVFGEQVPAGAHGVLKHSPRMVRWALSLANYDFEIIHVPGQKMVVADYLSRENGDVAAAGQVGGGYANPWRCRSWKPSLVPENLVSAPRECVANGVSRSLSGEKEAGTDCPSVGEQEAGVFFNQQSLNKTLIQEMQAADAVIGVICDFVKDQDQEKAKKRLLEVANPEGVPPLERVVVVDGEAWTFGCSGSAGASSTATS
jgi:hypothetical protein